MFRSIACLCLLAAAVSGQQAGTVQAETHPKLTWQQCTEGGSCTTVNGEIVLDANWRWTRVDGDGYDNCYTGEEWNTTVCTDNVACAQNCALEGADYSGTYGISTSGNALTLTLVTGSNVGSRTYLMEDEENYQIFNLLDKEFTFDVDVSKLPCGVNGALYFVEMEQNGGLGQGQNSAGAKYGTGYCDAQCPRDLKFINGEANAEGWESSQGNYGTCCNEMDIWEANTEGAAYTAHTCSVDEPYRCSGDECGDDGVCDKSGCDYSHYRLGDTSYYGPGKKVDTNSKITVVTQFIGNPLTEIRRFYIQNGQTIENSVVNITGVPNYDSITNEFCTDYKPAFGDPDTFAAKGGFSGISASLGRGHVLVLSLWVDYAANMLWLDSCYPQDADPSKPGVKRGDCPTTSGVPDDVISQSPDASVVYSNIRFGDIGSTTN